MSLLKTSYYILKNNKSISFGVRVGLNFQICDLTLLSFGFFYKIGTLKNCFFVVRIKYNNALNMPSSMLGLTFTEYLLLLGLVFSAFFFIVTHLNSKLIYEVDIMTTTFYRLENRGIEKFNNLRKVIDPVVGRSRI